MAEFKCVSKSFGKRLIIDNFSLELKKNTPTVIMGSSGCGKTTLLRIAAGLEKADSGEFSHDGEEIAYMFQEHRLLPWKNALQNVKAVLGKTDQMLAEKYLYYVGIDPATDGKKLPAELSGGMRQRVAFARFLAYAEASNSSLLLLDEPFSALDDTTAKKMALLLKDFAKDKTLLFVSHDESDAALLDAIKINI